MWSIFIKEFEDIEANFKEGDNIPLIFKNIPLYEFGKFLINVPSNYPKLKEFFPTMADESIQDSWTGSHGETLLKASVAFIRTLTYGYSRFGPVPLETSRILDFGCGWGRLIRLLYKYTPENNIYAVDPWDKSIQICKDNGIRAHLGLSDYLPRSLPFNTKFHLIFSFSVFTHLSLRAWRVALNTLKNYLESGGLLIISIRPKEFWDYYKNGKYSTEMKILHEKDGFAFKPHCGALIEGEYTYGDTSISLDFFSTQFPEWEILGIENNKEDAYQILLFLRLN